MGSAKATTDYRRRRKLNLIKVCGDKCNICGYDKVPDALEFHHIDEKNKSYGIASNGTCHDLEADLLEIQKCILVCANCHREIHAGFYFKSQLLSLRIYDENIAQILREEKQQLSEKTIYYCSNCGKQLSGKTITGLCAECIAKKRRVVKDRPKREELKKLIQTMAFTKIGEKYGVSDNTIRKWCKAENLPSTKKEISVIKDWEKI